MLRRGFVWMAVYVAILVAPLLIAFIGDRPSERGFWLEFGVACGFLALAMLALQFLVTARIQPLTWPFGIDVVLRFHGHVAYLALALLVAHIVIVAVEQSWTLLNPVEAHWTARFGQLGVVLLALAIVLSVWRVRLRLSYEAWHISHVVIAVAIIAFSFAHTLRAGVYTNATWKEVLWVAIAVAVVALLLYTRLVKPMLLARRPYKVVNVSEERGGAWTIELEPDGHEGLKFHPGQFAWLKVDTSPFAFGEHPFSFSSNPEFPERLRFTVKELGDFTSRLSDVSEGVRAYVDGPYGAFTLDRYPSRGYVFIAGGIGITPVISMLRALVTRGDRRPLQLIYANKNWDEVTYREELPGFEAGLNLDILHVLEEPPDDWDGGTGFVTKDLLDEQLPKGPERNQLQYFLCGPPVMIDAVKDALTELGIPLERIEYEEFALV
jgi:predicted ferric reductase